MGTDPFWFCVSADTKGGERMISGDRCSIEGCDRKAEIRGICKTCYGRLWRSGKIPIYDPENRQITDQSMPHPRVKIVSVVATRKRHAESIRITYLDCLENYRLATSLNACKRWRQRIRAALEEALALGITKEDLIRASERKNDSEEVVQDMLSAFVDPEDMQNAL